MKFKTTLLITLFISLLNELDCQVSPMVCTPGCSDPAALNYDSAADVDCGSGLGEPDFFCCVYPPLNDFCGNAIMLNLNSDPTNSYSYYYSQDSNDLSPEQEGSCWSSNLDIGEIWYSFSTEGELIDIEVTSGTEFQLAIYTDCSGPSIACSDFNILEGFCAEAGVEYFIEAELKSSVEASMYIEVKTSIYAAEENCDDALALNYDPNTICPSICLYEPGDLDGDNNVTVTDLGIFISAFGTPCVPGEYCEEDLDGNGYINVYDLGAMLNLFGN